MTDPIPRPLVIFELANNHAGDVEFGLQIIRAVHAAALPFAADFEFVFKLQYRHLDTFIHPDFRERSDMKYVKRFLDTRLAPEQCRRLRDEIRGLGHRAAFTPLAEPSVDPVEAHDFDIVKIASCSFTDWPLLERLASVDRPIIASTAGASIDDLDRVVSFLMHRRKELTLMHCVAEYPTPAGHANLNQIDLLRQRYPQLRIGFSTHEPPDDVVTVRLAAAKGATVFEKHVTLPHPDHKPNAYSATPQQVAPWLAAIHDSLIRCGVGDQRPGFSSAETDSLRSLRRGVFATRALATGNRITPADVFLAIPVEADQITANDLSKYTIFTLSRPVTAGQPITGSGVTRTETRGQVKKILERVNAVLKQSGAVVPLQLECEISHHYGIDRFFEFGATIITYFNREYSKKLLVMLPGQSHPEQYHKLKEETFIVVFGDLTLTLDGVTRSVRRGAIITVERGVKHVFSSTGGAVIEEISSTHSPDDSFYTDPLINTNTERKTILTYWFDQ